MNTYTTAKTIKSNTKSSLTYNEKGMREDWELK